MRRYLLGWSACTILWGVMLGSAAEPADQDVSALKAAGIATDGPGLVKFFRERTLTVGDEAHIKALVRQLGDDEFKSREQASRQLVLVGSRARPFLQAAEKDADPEIARRAHDCLERIARDTTGSALATAVRVLAMRQPPQAAAVLLNYLPSAEDERIADAIYQALPALALRDGKADPVLVDALTDKSAVKRAAAAAALCSANAPDVMPRVRKLLDDRDPRVRLRVGLALAAARDKDAVPVLIGLLDELPLAQTGLAISLLHRLAGDSAPTLIPESEAASRRKYRQAWETWWKDHRAKITPARLEQESRSLGFTLIVLLDRNTVADLDRSNRIRWKIDNLAMPLDAQLLPGEERVLIAEHQGNLVSERNLKGEIVWKKIVLGPMTAQRLSNGNTFITTRNQLLEVDKDGKEVSRYSRPDGGDFMRATKLRNGDIGCIVSLGGVAARYVRLTPSDKDYKEVKSWGVQVRTSGGRLEVLPNGHVLIPEMDNNRVVEYDADGQSVWEAAIDQPIAAVRLPNGNTVVTLMRENRAVELDHAGKEVWQFKSDSRVTRAFRR
jgi:hypothetical protein